MNAASQTDQKPEEFGSALAGPYWKTAVYRQYAFWTSNKDFDDAESTASNDPQDEPAKDDEPAENDE
ncbi:MAG: hypothetical protein Aurels2KO_58330 [Aureliella sp.]